MKHYSCWVRLNGDLRNEVQKENVTAAELAVIHAMHGQGSVIEVREVGQSFPNHAALRGRLERDYCHSENGRKVFYAIFPGSHSKLPESCEEIGLTCTKMPPREFVPNPDESTLEPDVVDQEIDQWAAQKQEEEKAKAAAAEMAGRVIEEAESTPAPAPEPTDPMAKARAAKKAKADLAAGLVVAT